MKLNFDQNSKFITNDTAKFVIILIYLFQDMHYYDLTGQYVRF